MGRRSVLVADNLYLFDDFSWELLYLITSAPDMGILLTTNIKHYERHPEYYELLGMGEPGRPVYVMQLGHLSKAETETLIKSFLHAESFPDSAFQLVWKTTHGNPGLVEELLQVLVVSGSLEVKEVKDSKTLEAVATNMERFERVVLQFLATKNSVQFQSISKIFLCGFDELPAREQYLLKLASITNGFFTLPLLNALLPPAMKADQAKVVESFRNLQRKKYISVVTHDSCAQIIPDMLMTLGDAYNFTKLHTRSLIYALIPRATRQVLHLQLAQAMEKLFKEEALMDLAPILAFHFHHGKNHEMEIRFWDMASQRAMKTGSFYLAASFLLKVLVLEPQVELLQYGYQSRCRILARWHLLLAEARYAVCEMKLASDGYQLVINLLNKQCNEMMLESRRCVRKFMEQTQRIGAGPFPFAAEQITRGPTSMLFSSLRAGKWEAGREKDYEVPSGPGAGLRYALLKRRAAGWRARARWELAMRGKRMDFTLCFDSKLVPYNSLHWTHFRLLCIAIKAGDSNGVFSYAEAMRVGLQKESSLLALGKHLPWVVMDAFLTVHGYLDYDRASSSLAVDVLQYLAKIVVFPMTAAHVQLLLGNVAAIRGDLLLARESCIAAAHLFASSYDTMGRADALNLLAFIHHSLGDLSMVRSIATELLQISNQAPNVLHYIWAQDWNLRGSVSDGASDLCEAAEECIACMDRVQAKAISIEARIRLYALYCQAMFYIRGVEGKKLYIMETTLGYAGKVLEIILRASPPHTFLSKWCFVATGEALISSLRGTDGIIPVRCTLDGDSVTVMEALEQLLTATRTYARNNLVAKPFLLMLEAQCQQLRRQKEDPPLFILDQLLVAKSTASAMGLMDDR
ncbi:unnamed protein product [Chrysoparadoxa australica]